MKTKPSKRKESTKGSQPGTAKESIGTSPIPQPLSLVARLADLVHERGLDARDLSQLPGLLKREGIDPTHVTPGVAHQANQLNRQRTEDMLDRFNREGTPAILLPANEDLHLLAARLGLQIFPGVSLFAFLRWAGKNGLAEDLVKRVLEFLGFIAPPWLFGKQLEYGARGWAVPQLTDEQESLIFEAVGSV